MRKSWTVKELVEELKCYSDDYEVLISNGRGKLLFINEIDLDEDDIVIIK